MCITKSVCSPLTSMALIPLACLTSYKALQRFYNSAQTPLSPLFILLVSHISISPILQYLLHSISVQPQPYALSHISYWQNVFCRDAFTDQCIDDTDENTLNRPLWIINWLNVDDSMLNTEEEGGNTGHMHPGICSAMHGRTTECFIVRLGSNTGWRKPLAWSSL